MSYVLKSIEAEPNGQFRQIEETFDNQHNLQNTLEIIPLDPKTQVAIDKAVVEAKKHNAEEISAHPINQILGIVGFPAISWLRVQTD